MARVTVEDCIEKIPNRFDLVLTAAQRARNIQKGELLTIDRDDDKNPVIALREIADETIDIQQIEDRIVQSMQRLNESEEEVTTSDEAATTAVMDGNTKPIAAQCCTSDGLCRRWVGSDDDAGCLGGSGLGAADDGAGPRCGLRASPPGRRR